MHPRVLYFVLILLASVQPADVLGQSNAQLKTLAERYWDARMERYPTTATANGDYRFNDRLDDLSLEAEREWASRLHALVVKVDAIPTTALSADDRLTHALLRRSLRDDLLLIDCGGSLTSLQPLDGPHLRFPLILVSQPFRNEKDLRDYIARLDAFPEQVDDVIAGLRAGMERGIVSPRVLIRKVIPQIQSQIVDDPRDSEFFKPTEHIDVVAAGRRSRVLEQLTAAIRNRVVPAYRTLLGFVRDEYLDACRDTVGLSARPGGVEAYEKLIRLHTTLPLSADEIHRIGLAEVERIRREMARVQKELGFDGMLDQFIEHTRTDKRHRFTSGEELVAAADAILQRTKPRLTRLFGRLPKADCVMKEIESFRAASSPVAYYNPPPEDGSRPGYYYINTHRPEERLRFTLEALTYHEAVPGHHLQIALHQESTDLPSFRRYAMFTAFIEGWALYTEKLGYEMGGYGTPEARYGQLTFDMWRACRLVVDTGMHAKGWTRQRAVDFMAKNTSLAPIDIEAEIDRYVSWPGQALAYKIGELHILTLREDAEERLGNRFDLRAFHDALLAEGAMPIDMLEKRVRSWIARQR